MQLFKMKWENIIFIMLLAATIYAWIMYSRYTETQMLELAIIPTVILIIVALGYKTIRTFRKESMKLWK